MKLVLILCALYIIVMPILLRLVALLHKKLLIDKRAANMRNNRAGLNNLPKPLWPKWKEHISFTMKDKRDLSIGKASKDKGGEPKTSGLENRKAFFLFHLVAIIIIAIGGFIGNWWVVLIGYLSFFIIIGWALNSSKDIIQARKKVYERMFNIAKLKLGQSAEYQDNPQSVIRVLDWNDYIRPQKVEFDVPDSFGAEGEEGFLRQFNQIFGTETTWVPSPNMEANPPTPGWNYEQGVVTLHAVPPLPTMAPWHERYVTAPGIAWSFFPIALGVENGVELMNEESGELEYVLGFDLSGEQAKEGKKHGLKVSPTVTTSPMVFVGGGTGGGKSLSIDTLVEVINYNSSINSERNQNNESN